MKEGSEARQRIDKTESAAIAFFEQQPLVHILNQTSFHKQRIQLFHTGCEAVIARIYQ
jgi:hypothetical protein